MDPFSGHGSAAGLSAPWWRRWRLAIMFGAGVSLVGCLVAWMLLTDSDSNRTVIGQETSKRAAPITPETDAPLVFEVTGDTLGEVEIMPPTTPPGGTAVPVSTAPPTVVPTIDPANPAVVARPSEQPQETLPPAPAAPPPPWAASTRSVRGGYTVTDVGCAASNSAGALDVFFAQRLGPMLGADYQHVYPLGGERYLWLLQDAFIDHPGRATRLGQAKFAHNIALVQHGACFSLWHRGSSGAPKSFEGGTGETKGTWFWPLGGETANGRLQVFWVEMLKDGYEPRPGDGLGWHPVRTWIGTYDASTLERLDFRAAPNPGVTPIYGYAVASDSDYSYLFANTFEQNLQREGGYPNGPHSATKVWLGRVPLGRLQDAPEYWNGAAWSRVAADAQPILQRYWAEFPMQPRYLGGRWVMAARVNGYWGIGDYDGDLAIDVAEHPWGPWTNTPPRLLQPRGNDPKMNNYHAHLMPWLDDAGMLVVSVSQNARNMIADAYPAPHRYRMTFVSAQLATPPVEPPVTVATTLPVTSTTVATTVPATTQAPSTTTAATTIAPTTVIPTTIAPTTVAPTTVASTVTTAQTTAPATAAATTPAPGAATSAAPIAPP